MNQKEKDRECLRIAYRAAKASPDLSTQNGAILVQGEMVIGMGCNKYPRGLEITPERLESPEKYSWVIHAEESAIIDAARQGNATEGAKMYCPWFACDRCAPSIIEAGIEEIVGYSGPERWAAAELGERSQQDWDKSIGKALIMFDSAGVKYRWIDEPLFTPDEHFEIRFQGKLVSP